jgi:signal transduction histidine kinase
MATIQWQWARVVGRIRLSSDGLIALSLVAVMAGTALGTGHSSIGARLGAVAAAFGLIVLIERRRHPVPVLVATFAVVFVEELLSPHGFSVASFLAIMVATYSLGAHAPRRSLAIGMAIGAVGVAIGHALGNKTSYSDVSSDAFFLLILVVGPAVVGRLVRVRLQLVGRLREATTRLAAARSERVAAALAADRVRLSESIDATLLDGFGRMLAHAECETLAQVSALERIARELLSRMRSLLKDLRGGEEERQPANSITELHARVRRAIEAEAELLGPTGAPVAASSAAPMCMAPSSRWALVSPGVIDAALAIVAAVVGAGLLASTIGATALHGPRWAEALLAVAVAAPIAFARRFALQATAVSVLAASVYVALAQPGDPSSGWLPTGALVVFPLALAATCPAPRAAAGLALCVGQFVGLPAMDPVAKLHPTTVAPGLAIAVGALVAGGVLRDRTRMLAALADTAVGIEDEREQLARSALATERARVARDLHDAVGHAMTVIVLQAGAARRVWESHPRLAREHAAALRDTVSDVVTELRGMLVELGSGNQHGPAQLEQLVRRAERSGMRLEVEVAGDPSRVASALEYNAYRVLQEALTNAARHAPGAGVLVRLDYQPSGLAVEVVNERPTLTPLRTDGSGHGLRGMRERVEGSGGRLSVGAGPAGGFAVRAWLPSP